MNLGKRKAINQLRNKNGSYMADNSLPPKIIGIYGLFDSLQKTEVFFIQITSSVSLDWILISYVAITYLYKIIFLLILRWTS